MRSLKQSTSRKILVVMIDSTDHVTGKTGLTLTVTISKNGAALAAPSAGTVVERTFGGYEITFDTTDTDTLGDLWIHISATGADPVDVVLQVVLDLPGVAQTGDNYTRLGAPAGASLAADIAAVNALTTAAAIRSALGMASNNLDTQLAAIAAFVDTEVAAILAAVDTEITSIKSKTDLIPGTQDGLTFANVCKLIAAVLLGKASGGPYNSVFRSPDDAADRVTSVSDVDGNRTTVTLNP